MDWFRHDLNAHDDIKIKKVLKRYGFCALGIYWFLIELICCEGGRLNLNVAIDEVSLIDGLSEEEAKNLINNLVSTGLVFIDGKQIGSHRSDEEIAYAADRRQKKVDAGRKGGMAKASNAKANSSNATSTSSNATSNSSTLPNHTLPNQEEKIELISNDIRSKKEADSPNGEQDVRNLLGERYEGVRKSNEGQCPTNVQPMSNSSDNSNSDKEISDLDGDVYSLYTEREEEGETKKEKEEKKGNKEKNKEKENKREEEREHTPTPLKIEETAAFNGVSAHDIAPEYQARFNKINGVIKCERMTVNREMAVYNILRNFSIGQINTAFDKVAKSDYLHGLNKFSWVVTFDWLFNVDHFTNVLEGTYDNKNVTIPVRERTNMMVEDIEERRRLNRSIDPRTGEPITEGEE